MRSRLIIAIVAVVLGIVAAFGAAAYLATERGRIAAGAQLVNVLVAQQDLPLGMSADELMAKGYLVSRQIPRQYVAADAISSQARLLGRVVSQPISKDQMVTDAMFKYAADVGLASSTPKGYLAISIPYEQARGVAGLVKPGDSVAVLATFKPEGGVPLTKLILPKVKVLAVGKALDAVAEGNSTTVKVNNSGGLMSSGGQTAADQTPGTITLALTPVDAEKLVFAQEQGKTWLALYSPNDPGSAKALGVTYDRIGR